MTVAAIAKLAVSELAHAEGAHLYLCTINGFVEAAYGVARSWGFVPSTLLTWAKATMGGGLGGAFGISTEFVLFARRGRLRHLRREPRSWFTWPRPYVPCPGRPSHPSCPSGIAHPRHSAKPPALFSLIEQVSPGPRAELFARDPRAGWARWGNEIDSTIMLESA